MIINDLIESGIILEMESRSTRSGRPPVVLDINPKCGLAAAIDMGATHIRVAVGDFSAQIQRNPKNHSALQMGRNIASKKQTALRSVLEKRGLKISDLSAIGLGVPGPVITDTGMVMAPPIMPGWDRFPIRTTLENRWKVPLALNNDANFGAVGEWVFGAGAVKRILLLSRSAAESVPALLLTDRFSGYHGVRWGDRPPDDR